VNGKVGVTGFCWGGGVVNQLAVHDPKLVAASPFYGRPPEAEDVAKIKARMVLNYADPELDTGLGKQLPGYEAALKKYGIRYELHTYKGANHAFFDDTGARYNAAAAKAAWGETLAWFAKYLA
jgi:carboxymethylenebutenolidase